MPPTQLISFALSFKTSRAFRRCATLRRLMLLTLMLIGTTACAENKSRITSTDDSVAAVQLAADDSSLGNQATLDAQRTAALGGGTTGVLLDLEDTVWIGGYREANNGAYGGRTATWIYGAATEFSSIEATFVVEARPFGTAELNVEGMDSSGSDKTPIAIAVNGQEIYNGPSQLPDDSLVETKPWDSYTWTFNAQILKPGRNTISITNLALGAFSDPPFLVLDYAQITYEEQ